MAGVDPRAACSLAAPHTNLVGRLEIATTKVVAHVRDRRTTVDFLSFMDDVVTSYPLSPLHVVLDKLNIHNNQAAKQWLLHHPRVHFHYTPTHASWMNASWMNMVECFFSILTRQALPQSVHPVQKGTAGVSDSIPQEIQREPRRSPGPRAPNISCQSSEATGSIRQPIPSSQSNGNIQRTNCTMYLVRLTTYWHNSSHRLAKPHMTADRC